MKALLLTLSLLSFIQFAHAEDVTSATTWVDTNNVYISNSQNPEIARHDCETTMQILSIMNNDKIVFQSRCDMVAHPRCKFYYCYQLSVRAFVIPSQQ